MRERIDCSLHHRGFEHLALNREAAAGFHLGFRYWLQVVAQGRFWVLIVSYDDARNPGCLEGFRHYAMRSGIPWPSEGVRLLTTARPRIKEEMKALGAGRRLAPTSVECPLLL